MSGGSSLGQMPRRKSTHMLGASGGKPWGARAGSSVTDGQLSGPWAPLSCLLQGPVPPVLRKLRLPNHSHRCFIHLPTHLLVCIQCSLNIFHAFWKSCLYLLSGGSVFACPFPYNSFHSPSGWFGDHKQMLLRIFSDSKATAPRGGTYFSAIALSVLGPGWLPAPRASCLACTRVVSIFAQSLLSVAPPGKSEMPRCS